VRLISDAEQREDRPEATRLAASVIWLTGLSGSGKSTIGQALVARLAAITPHVEYLDGDIIRDFLPQTGFSREERDAHVTRVGFLASRLEHHGVTVVCALISPYAAARTRVRGLCRRFIEVHVATPLDECERRDAKGLYARARAGEIQHFTGVDDPYEAPETPEVTIDTRAQSIDEAVETILSVVAGRVPAAGR
jgi:adenylylsulfate kinase